MKKKRTVVFLLVVVVVVATGAVVLSQREGPRYLADPGQPAGAPRPKIVLAAVDAPTRPALTRWDDAVDYAVDYAGLDVLHRFAGVHVLNRPGGRFYNPDHPWPKLPAAGWRALERSESHGRQSCIRSFGGHRVVGWLIVIDKVTQAGKGRQLISVRCRPIFRDQDLACGTFVSEVWQLSKGKLSLKTCKTCEITGGWAGISG